MKAWQGAFLLQMISSLLLPKQNLNSEMPNDAVDGSNEFACLMCILLLKIALSKVATICVLLKQVL